MNYDTFRTLLHEALSEAGLLPFPPWPSEKIDLRDMSRMYEIYIHMHDRRRAEPFHICLKLDWRWDALQSARTSTTEEDLLVQLFGEDGYDLDTERPWLRVDVTLSATLLMGEPLPMPENDAWQRWAGEMMQRMATLLPDEIPGAGGENATSLLFWRGDPVAQLECHPDGQLYLTGVELRAWQGINLPRQWDNPDRPPDGWSDAQLAGFADRLHQALQEWEDCLVHLHRER